MNGVILFWLFTFLCLGAVIGGMIERWLNRRSKGSARSSTSNNMLAKEGDLEILRAWRSQAGKIWLEMDGKRLEDKSVLQADQQRRLLNLVLDLRPWLGAAPTVEQVSAIQPAIVESVPSPVKKAVKGTNEKAPPAPAMKNMIEQINDVLQSKLATSVFKDREIQLLESPEGGVTVKDGGNDYDGIDSVPDAEVRSLIRQAVSEWEKSAK
jgi:hypothetical protein